MSRLQHFLLKRIFRNQVRQGEGHAKRIQYLYLMVRHAVEEEFPEDPFYTLKVCCDAAKEVRVIPTNEIELLRNQIVTLQAKLKDVYSERNRLAAGFARMALMAGFKAGLLKGTLSGSEGHFVYVDTPNGQVSWYVTDRDSEVLCSLPAYNGNWDQHYRAREKAWCVWDIKPAD
jgi:hypothetical protein